MNKSHQGKTVISLNGETYTGSAIYALVDKNGKRYVGQAARFQERMRSHESAFQTILKGSDKKFPEGEKMVQAVKEGITFTAIILRKLEGGEATINNLRYWEDFYLTESGGIDGTYNMYKPPAPLWEHDPFNIVIIDESPSEIKRKRQIANITKWQKKKTKQCTLRLNKKYDADIIEILEKADSVQGYIKKAIRAYDE